MQWQGLGFVSVAADIEVWKTSSEAGPCVVQAFGVAKKEGGEEQCHLNGAKRKEEGGIKIKIKHKAKTEIKAKNGKRKTTRKQTKTKTPKQKQKLKEN